LLISLVGYENQHGSYLNLTSIYPPMLLVSLWFLYWLLPLENLKIIVILHAFSQTNTPTCKSFPLQHFEMELISTPVALEASAREMYSTISPVIKFIDFTSPLL
jgi:hypothetical protein